MRRVLFAVCLMLPTGVYAVEDPADFAPSKEQVMTLQRLLKERVSELRVSGVIDKATEGELREFQRENGLPPTGKLDYDTAQLVEAIVAGDRPFDRLDDSMRAQSK